MLELDLKHGPGQMGGQAKLKGCSVEMYWFRESKLKIQARSGSLGRKSKISKCKTGL